MFIERMREIKRKKQHPEPAPPANPDPHQPTTTNNRMPDLLNIKDEIPPALRKAAPE
jgi:hypothetical protein